jgi:PAS domain S-box-containing protein
MGRNVSKPSYRELQAKVKELQQIVNIKVFPNKLQFVSEDHFYFRLDRDWFLSFFDRGLSSLTGYSAEELHDRSINWLELAHEADRPIILEELKRALASDKSFRCVHRITNKSGKTRWVKVRGALFCDDDNRYSFIQGVMNDVTRERLIEEALESEFELFTWVANSLEDGIYIVSDDHKIRFMNQALIDLVGDHVGEQCYRALFGRESVCPWSVMHFIQQDSCGFQDYVFEEMGRAFQVRSYPIKMRDGTRGKLGQLKDITKTKLLQYELKEVELRQESLSYAADVADVGIFIAQNYKGLEARFRYANEAFCRITGFDSSELRHTSLSEIMPQDSYEKILSLVNRENLMGKGTCSCEVNLIRRDGIPMVAHFTASSSIYRGKPALAGFLQDITERRKAQDSLWLSQRLASIGKLAAEVAHEINNPLTSILTFTKLALRVLDRQMIEPQRITSLKEYLQFMESEANRCGGIARNLLDFSRQGEIEVKENNVRKIVEKTLDILRHRAEMGNIQLETSFDPEIPNLPCDYKRLQQALMNIFWNGIEAMPMGGVLKISIRYKKVTRQVQVEIQDNGSGISKENLGKIFEPFFTTKAESKGVGLGLSVSYGIIQQHGGTIEVKSRPGKGTNFLICLPTEGGAACGMMSDHLANL